MSRYVQGSLVVGAAPHPQVFRVMAFDAKDRSFSVDTQVTVQGYEESVHYLLETPDDVSAVHVIVLPPFPMAPLCSGPWATVRWEEL